MNDCMVKALDRFYQQEYSHTFFPLFRDDMEKPKGLSDLQYEVVARFPDTEFTVDQMKQVLMQESTLLVSGKSYRDAVMALKKADRL